MKNLRHDIILPFAAICCFVCVLACPLPAAENLACYGDLNMDGDVDGRDLTTFLEDFDGQADRLEMLAAHFGRQSCPDCDQTPVSIIYGDSTVTIDNPWEDAGVDIAASGAYVTVTSVAGVPGIIFALSGATGDGTFKLYSEDKVILQLNGVTITSTQGPAINIQSGKTISVELGQDTESVLTDGEEYAEAPDDEDQKAAFFSEGQLIFSGGGSLTINGRGDDQHGLVSDDYIQVDGGTIYVTGSNKDGIHTNDGYYQSGGMVDVFAGSDGVDAGDGPVRISGGDLAVEIDDDDRDAVKCDGDLTISGGTIDLLVNGDQSKGLKAETMLLSGGTITIETHGDAVLEEVDEDLGYYDPSYCTAIKPEEAFELDGATVTITTDGLAGRGISGDGDVVISSGELTVTASGGGGTYTNEDGEADAYHGVCIKADGNLDVTGGTVSLAHSGDGGRGISVDGTLTIGTEEASPTLEITTSGDEITIGWDDAAEAKAVKADGQITIAGGNITINSADDGIKSEEGIQVNGGVINIQQSFEGMEAPDIEINGGELHIVSTDDGLNATTGGASEFDDGSTLVINDGYVAVTALEGDGIDSNGTLTITGGTLIAHGPATGPNVGVDVNGEFLITGGLVIVSQVDSNMVEVPTVSGQYAVLLTENDNNGGNPGGPGGGFHSVESPETPSLFHIEDSAGNSLVTFQPAHTYSSILFSSPSLNTGTTYKVYTGGTSTCSEEDGLYTGGTYSGGTSAGTFTIDDPVEKVSYGSSSDPDPRP